uniref:uncharacterized protein LOC120332831 n=1 Tax=Styela clava TaxID=7725 RepID=UPI00193A2F6E|nr:uncharacterized protein LOC120332831 [Styela clava]
MDKVPVVDPGNSLADHELVQDTIWPEEHVMADKLRECCTIFGKEKESKLLETAHILLEMGQLYMVKAKNATGMLQKLTFLRCAALLNGAKVRFHLKNKQDGESEVEKFLELLGFDILKSASAVKPETNLLEESKIFFESVIEMREDCKTMLSGDRELISDTVKYPERSEYEFDIESRNKSSHVKKMNKDLTNAFTNLMTRISKKCVDVMGEPPCKFATVGLGSLAREEITPYSDFEHVIILQEGVQKRPDYISIKEYFRWYAVCFQIIIINFGETFIRSMGVKSLNDLYSENKKLNWFYDTYTPCGIAFDGLVPHSCNNPLGRVEPTERKRFPLELIQPISEMTRLVNLESRSQNGYYVNEVLTRTCFVYGNQNIFDTFKHRVETTIKFENLRSLAGSQGELIHFNPLDSVKMWSPSVSSYFNTKATMYRPITVLLSSIARSIKIEAVTSFDIVQNLLKFGVIKENFAVDIDAALALTFDLRIKDYVKGGDQRYKGEFKRTLKTIGFKNLYAFYIILEKIRLLAYCCFGKPFMTGHFPWGEQLSNLIYGFLKRDVVKASILYMFQQYDEAIDIAMDLLETKFETIDDNDVASLLRIVGGYLYKYTSSNSRFSDTGLCLKRLGKVIQMDKIKLEWKFYFFPVIAELCMQFGYEDRAIMFCKEGIFRFNNWHPCPPPIHVLQTKQFLDHGMVLVLLKQGRYAEASQICSNFFKNLQTGNVDLRWKYITSWIKAEFGMNQTEAAKAALRNLYNQIKTSPGFSNETNAISALYRILDVQYDNGMHEDFCQTYELFDSLTREVDVRAEHPYQKFLMRMGKKVTEAYLLLNKYENCIDAAKRNISSVKNVNDSGFRKILVDKSVFHNLGVAHCILSQTSPTRNEKISHLKNGIIAFNTGCPLSKQAVLYYQQALSVLTCTLLEISDSSLSCTVMRELCLNISICPTSVRRSESVQKATYDLISYISKKIVMNERVQSSAELSKLVIEFPAMLPYEVTQPFTYLELMRICKNRLDKEFCTSAFEQCFCSRYKSKSSSAIYKDIVVKYSKYDLFHCAHGIWRLLHTGKVAGSFETSVHFLFYLILHKTNHC